MSAAACLHTWSTEDRGAWRCQLCGGRLDGGADVPAPHETSVVGAVRELEPGAVAAADISKLDAVLTLARVSFDAHRRSPGKALRLDAVNKLRIAEQLLHTAIEQPRGEQAPEAVDETQRLLQGRLRQTRKRLRSLNDTSSTNERSGFGSTVVPKGKYFDATKDRKPSLPTGNNIARKKRPQKAGSTIGVGAI